MLKSHKLEEYTTWEKQFNAYYDHNSKVLETQPNTVRRQLLDNCIESNLINALDTDPTINENTPITGNESCLTKLKAIFLKDNPLFHRRYNFMKYVQEPNQDFHTVWTSKLMKAKECDLENIDREAILLVELIRGVRDDKLRAEFLKQPNPTVKNLCAIAQNWQTASVTGKSFGLDSIHVNKAGISTYKLRRTNVGEASIARKTKTEQDPTQEKEILQRNEHVKVVEELAPTERNVQPVT